MRPNRTLEIGTGLFVLLGFAALLFLTTQLPVPGIRFDSKEYKAVVNLRIDPQYNQIPEDSFASIQTTGLLGGKYIGLSPGGLDSYLKDGGRIEQTQSAIVLESLVNKFFANYASKGGDSQSQGGDNRNKVESKK
ncbi:MAG: MCE family protein [Gammaproteobacteria bacterium]|nr:MAG: MCE family protein [Gammaproteobacteria bacterium]